MPDSLLINYSAMPLNRASAERKNGDWIIEQLNRRDARFACLHLDCNLIDDSGSEPVAAFLSRDSAEQLIANSNVVVLLGTNHGRPYFALNVEPADAAELSSDGLTFINLRELGPRLNHRDGSLLAYARGLIYWHRQNQFCGICGSPTHSTQGGHVRSCANAECAHNIFPRTDPAVIMLVEDLADANNPRCLLGRNQKFAARMFSTLAGFVDPGETLEQTVAREVFEEAGIRVNNVRYQASQPWPFPSSIMLGFRATAQSLQIDTNADEIEEAYWFGAREILTFGEWGDGGNNNCLPRKDSIARYLVDSWVKDVLNETSD